MLSEIDESIAAVKAQLRYHRSNVTNRTQVERNLEAKRATIAKLQREVDSEQLSLEQGPELIPQLVDRLAELNADRLEFINRDKIAKVLALAAALEDACAS
jgi:uncharacterized coiled-coil DUF342 family protein